MSDPTGADLVCAALEAAGVDLVVGLPGTQTLPLDRAIADSEGLRYVMARHETAIPHVAWGHYEAGGGMAATLTVPGPGDANALHGLANAREDRVPLVHLAAEVDPAARGKGPIHEFDPRASDPAVVANHVVSRPAELPPALARAVARATAEPPGPVRLGVPRSILAGEVAASRAVADPGRTTVESGDDLGDAADRLADADRPVVYVGRDARRTDREAVADLCESLGCPVVVSPKGKGVLDEADPAWLGVTAAHLPAGARRVLDAADVVLALGTGFDGVATDGWSLPMGEALVHVTPEADLVDRAYEADVAVVADVGPACRDLLDALLPDDGGWDGAAVGRAVREEYRERLADRDLLADRSPAPTPAVLTALRERLPPETTVVTDVGGFRLWAMQVFAARPPGAYVTAGSWAGMGVGLPGAIGAALADPPGPVVCLHGDGGLMMCAGELHVAAEEALDLTVVVFDNADYGIVSRDPEICDRGDGHAFGWESPDFAALADAFGVRGWRAENAAEAADLVEAAVGRAGPDLVSVAVDPDEPTVTEAADYESTVDL